jgi:hypothetical protein
VLHENNHDCKEGGCKHEITDSLGDISSPHFPDSYPAKKDCVWIFSTTPGHRIKLVSNMPIQVVTTPPCPSTPCDKIFEGSFKRPTDKQNVAAKLPSLTAIFLQFSTNFAPFLIVHKLPKLVCRTFCRIFFWQTLSVAYFVSPWTTE